MKRENNLFFKDVRNIAIYLLLRNLLHFCKPNIMFISRILLNDCIVLIEYIALKEELSHTYIQNS